MAIEAKKLVWNLGKVGTISPSDTAKKFLEAIDNGLSGEKEIEGVGKFSPPSAYSWIKEEPKLVLSHEEQTRRGKEDLISLLCNSPKFKELATSLEKYGWQAPVDVLSADMHQEVAALTSVVEPFPGLFKIEEGVLSCIPLLPEKRPEGEAA